MKHVAVFATKGASGGYTLHFKRMLDERGGGGGRNVLKNLTVAAFRGASGSE
jgi:hypothetical protein